MKVSRPLATISLLFSLTPLAWSARPPDLRAMQREHNEKLCASSAEYIEALGFLRDLKLTSLSEKVSRDMADRISRHCTGAAARFSSTFTLLKKMGVAHRQSLKIALAFAEQSEEVKENFFEVLKLSYVAEMFDLNFAMALEVAYEFSIHLESHHQQARKDFVQLAEFCSGQNKPALPIRICAQLAVDVARLSPHFPGGVFPYFAQVIQRLRKDEEFLMSVKESLEVTYQVLRFGSRAPENFFQAYEFAVEPKGLQLSKKQALAFAMTMAERSTPIHPPPVVELEAE